MSTNLIPTSGVSPRQVGTWPTLRPESGFPIRQTRQAQAANHPSV